VAHARRAEAEEEPVGVLIGAAYAVLGAVGGAGVDLWVRRAADAEERDGTMPTGDDVRHAGRLDRHLTGGRWRRALVPVLSAIGCLLVGLRFGADPGAVPFLFFVPVIAGLAVVDLHTRRLPNVLTLPSYVAGILLVGFVGVHRGDPGVPARAVGAAVLLFVVFLLLSARPTGMGMGDVKAAGMIGLFVGSLGIGAALVAAFLAASGAFVIGLVLVATGVVPRRTPTPFGPYLAAGAMVAVLAGPALFTAYQGAIG
jgi:leader peptidase (prepilin peptidase) / N-methyltransferase